MGTRMYLNPRAEERIDIEEGEDGEEGEGPVSPFASVDGAAEERGRASSRGQSAHPSSRGGAPPSGSGGGPSATGGGGATRSSFNSGSGNGSIDAINRSFFSFARKTTLLPQTVGRSVIGMSDEAVESIRQHAARGTLDRGEGFYRKERERLKLPSLLETGKYAGRSRVDFIGVSKWRLLYHLFKRDFFISAINASLWTLAAIITLLYIITFFAWAILWWAVNRAYGSGVCFTAPGEDPTGDLRNFADAVIFSTITQTTIGYGNVSILPCWGGAWMLVGQSLMGMIMDSIVIGIVFARISHPKQRSRTIFISDSACISRRDGVLKFMFRIADVRRSQVIEAKIVAYLYTWGEGRTTAEGEFIPFRSDPMHIDYIDGMLLLPITIEHTIDERSPLYGHTYETLMALQAEIVITFEGTTEFGNPFMARQSYLAPELHFGYRFAKIVKQPSAGQTFYTVDLSKFHEIVPEPGLPMLPPAALSRLVVSRQRPTVPYPLLGENTLCVSEVACVCMVDGKLTLMWRVGDTYPNQMCQVHARAFIYRWDSGSVGGGGGGVGGGGGAGGGGGSLAGMSRLSASGRPIRNTGYTQHELELGYGNIGEDRLLLRLPHICRHVIDDSSPLASWREEGGRLMDADSDIVFVVEGFWYCNSKNVMRMRTYNVFNSVKFDHKFVNIITPPQHAPDFKPRVDWSRFHEVERMAKVPVVTRTVSKLGPDLTPAAVEFLRRMSTRANNTTQAGASAMMSSRAAAQAASPKSGRGGSDFSGGGAFGAAAPAAEAGAAELAGGLPLVDPPESTHSMLLGGSQLGSEPNTIHSTSIMSRHGLAMLQQMSRSAAESSSQQAAESSYRVGVGRGGAGAAGMGGGGGGGTKAMDVRGGGSRPGSSGSDGIGGGGGVPVGGSSYMGEVLGMGGDLQRYTMTTGAGSGRRAMLAQHGRGEEEYDESLAVMTKSPDNRVPYNRLNSLFEAAEKMDEEERRSRMDEEERHSRMDEEERLHTSRVGEGSATGGGGGSSMAAGVGVGRGGESSMAATDTEGGASASLLRGGAATNTEGSAAPDDDEGEDEELELASFSGDEETGRACGGGGRGGEGGREAGGGSEPSGGYVF